MKDEKKVFVGFQCEEAVKIKLEEIARTDKRSMSSLLEIIVEKWINENSAADPK